MRHGPFEGALRCGHPGHTTTVGSRQNDKGNRATRSVGRGTGSRPRWDDHPSLKPGERRWQYAKRKCQRRASDDRKSEPFGLRPSGSELRHSAGPCPTMGTGPCREPARPPGRERQGDALVRRHSWLLGPIVLASTCRLGLTCFGCTTSEHSKLERPARTLGKRAALSHSAHKVSIFRGTR
jgi:hypothetical protein